ncbi:unnamed protein product, partial [Prorocentrum cordatum]
ASGWKLGGTNYSKDGGNLPFYADGEPYSSWSLLEGACLHAMIFYVYKLKGAHPISRDPDIAILKNACKPPRTRSKNQGGSGADDEENEFAEFAVEVIMIDEDGPDTPEPSDSHPHDDKIPVAQPSTAPACDKIPAAQPDTTPACDDKIPAAQPNTAPACDDKIPAAQPDTAPACDDKIPAAQPSTAMACDDKIPESQPDTATASDVPSQPPRSPETPRSAVEVVPKADDISAVTIALKMKDPGMSQ